MKPWFLLLLLLDPDLLAGTLIENVRLFDADPAAGPVDILVEDGRITQIGRSIVAVKHQVYNGQGFFVTPGLIDAHTHLASVPGADYRKDPVESVERQQRLQLASYLAAGVTTVLDATIPWPTYGMLKDYVQRTGIGPRLVVLGPALMPVGGYLATDNFRKGPYAALWPPVRNDQEIRDMMLRSQTEKTLGIKIAMEDGLGPISNYETFADKQRALIAEFGQQNHINIFVHSYSEKEHAMALELRPYALLHAGFKDDQPSPEILQKIFASGPYVVTTNAIYDLMGMMWDPQAIEKQGLSYLVPPEQLRTMNEVASIDYVGREVLKESMPSWLPWRWMLPLKDKLFNKKITDDLLKSSQNAIRLMHQKGIRLVMGSDSGNWPIFTTFFHGYGTLREMELLQDAGIPPAEVVEMATNRAAKMLELDQEVGTLQPGKAADLVLLKENPLQSKTAFRTIQAVMKGGVIRTPKEWIALGVANN